MTVYVDSMRAPFRGMLMCHMAADTHSELMAMAEKLGLRPEWLQKTGTYLEHFDIDQSKRSLAVRYGAVEVSRVALMRVMRAKRK